MMIYNFLAASIVVVLAGSIAIPALRRFIRNIHLTRKGNITSGYYLDSNKVTFLLETRKRVVFSTWRNLSNVNEKLEVLYDPQHPEKAEIRSTKSLWIKPADALSQALGLIAMASLLVQSVNYWLALCLGITCVIVLAISVRISLMILMFLSLKYRLFSRFSAHIFAGFTPKYAKK